MNKNSRGIAPILIVVILGVIGIIGYLVLSQPSPTQDETANWITYSVTDSITYKLPSYIDKPLCANAGCYYKQTNLPNNSTLAIIPVGENAPGFLLSWDELVKKAVEKNNFYHQDTKVQGLEAIDFRGTLNEKNTPDINLLTEGKGSFRGTLIKVRDGLSLEVILYQDQFTEDEINFSADEVIYDQILSTFRFLEEEVTKEEAEIGQ